MYQPLIKFNLSSFHQILFTLSVTNNLLTILSSQIDKLIPQHQTIVSKGQTYIETGNSGYL